MDPFSIVSRLLEPFGSPPAFRLGATAADFAREGLRATPQRWEDGRRIRWEKGEYEWWYFDGHFPDGHTAVGTYAVTEKHGKLQPLVRLAITDPQGKTWSKVVEINPDRCVMLVGECDVTFGRHTFRGTGAHYRIVLHPEDTGGLGWDLTLERRVAPWRPGTGVIHGGDKRFAWVPAVPEGRLHGTLTYNGQRVQVDGSGYHDHNWGDTPMPFVTRGWTWGRVKVGDYTVVVADVHPSEQLEGDPIPLMLVTTPEGTLVDAYCTDVKVVETGFTAHPDPRNREDRLPSTVRFTAREGNVVAVVELTRGEDMLESTDLVRAEEVGARPWQIAAADLVGLTPWYTRFRAECTLTLGNSAPLRGTGTLEFMDFR